MFAAPREYPYNQQTTLNGHHWEHRWHGVDDSPTYENSEAEQVGAGGWG